MKRYFIFLEMFVSIVVSAQNKKSVEALLINSPLIIDGILNEPIYSISEPATDFVQLRPYNGSQSMQPSKVYVFYDNSSIYIGAELIDSAPDSIFNFLTERDNIGMSDYFGVYIDPYNKGLVAYGFFITPSGIQIDIKASKVDRDIEDVNWNAVWQSKTTVTKKGWSAEFRIPLSALRFPKETDGIWGINFTRNIRRYNSNNTWSMIDLKKSGFLDQQGELTGIKNLKAPLRLSFSPFASVYYQPAGKVTPSRFQYKGGMDLKYGINESFTLDLMVIPDFGQVQSDDKRLNISPFELYYSEKRQFFTEGTELFDRGGIFYSRRIGSSPKFTNKITSEIRPTEILKYCPSETQLINATKISGRTSNGWGLGFLNSVSLPSKAVLIDTLTENERIVLVQPTTNYNISVVERALKNNSYLSFVNTNMLIQSSMLFSNVMATDFQIRNRKRTMVVRGKSGISLRRSEKQESGFFSTLGIEKDGGSLRYGISQKVYSDKYNPNDMGYLEKNDEVSFRAFVTYNKDDPFWIFREFHGTLTMDHIRRYREMNFSYNNYHLGSFAVFKNNYLAILNLMYIGNKKDYYEPRVIDRYFLASNKIGFTSGIVSDFRKPVTFNLFYNRWNEFEFSGVSNAFSSDIGIRLGQRIQLYMNTSNGIEKNNKGFVELKNSGDTIIFSRRNIKTFENSFSGSYIINNKSSITLRFRHYWSVILNKEFFKLNNEGRLDPYPDYKSFPDQNFNTSNLDILYRWIFAPGSELTVSYKNSLFGSTNEIPENYSESIQKLFQSYMPGIISIKVLYYFDYNNLRDKK